MNLPGDLQQALERWLGEQRGSRAAAAQELSAAYRQGKASSSVSLVAYVTTRLAATHAACQRVFSAFQTALPDSAPRSLLDVGTGPGTAVWAACNVWPQLEAVLQCEQDNDFAALASRLNSESSLSLLQRAEVFVCAEARLPLNYKADIVVASYVLAEMPLDAMALTTKRLWGRAERALVLIEPGTPQGFARLKIAREMLLGQGAFVVAPCTHQLNCPMTDQNWCHFKTRVQRSREHMHAKQASVPFEDEAFSYLVLSRQPVPQLGGRIVAPVAVNKVVATLPLCDATGLHDVTVASRDKPAYKRAKKKAWGDVWE